ncbi:uncharacterized protein BO97DRAFT_271223 [Aspergillus homomorphus CBS 101889]|uniref:Uncharacterized protein n=1 Tax=Aspergillus homomorphus (strain CBS 101889) TaxID=1450537 RepID=A0A395I8N3_ASPHC|nr:hypothetical protein BO97DRAFT_271223 [Aspergillus homomorphus CBS 101889]RAL14494.1 hypothetical protein BO97DRAFT_271223 [Aspergillus homomorphus CBS 101889]
MDDDEIRLATPTEQTPSESSKTPRAQETARNPDSEEPTPKPNPDPHQSLKRPLSGEPPTQHEPEPYGVWPYCVLPHLHWPVDDDQKPQWLSAAHDNIDLFTASNIMRLFERDIREHLGPEFEVVTRPVAFTSTRDRCFRLFGRYISRRDNRNADQVRQFCRREKRPYHAALFATRQGRQEGSRWHWWAIASIRRPGHTGDPDEKLHLFLYDSEPLQIEAELNPETQEGGGLENYLRKDQCLMLHKMNQEVPIQHLFVNRLALKIHHESDLLRQTLWWMWNIVNIGNRPYGTGSEDLDSRWRVIHAVTLEFRDDPRYKVRRMWRKLRLKSVKPTIIGQGAGVGASSAEQGVAGSSRDQA